MFNLTQHKPTPDQLAAGVVDLPAELTVRRNALITFEDLPTQQLLEERAMAVAELAKEDFKKRGIDVETLNIYVSERGIYCSWALGVPE